VFFSAQDKIEIAKKLDAAGIQFIEAGFPVVSKADQEAIELFRHGRGVGDGRLSVGDRV